MLYQFILPFSINDNRIIKVGDFGISKDYLRSYYRHWSNTESEKTVIKLPFKWMALETLMMVYSLRREMWSVYFILLTIIQLYSGHMVCYVGRCSVLVKLPILV